MFALGRVYARLPRTIQVGRFYAEYQRRIRMFQGMESAGCVFQAQQQLVVRQVNAAIGSIPLYRQHEAISDATGLLSLPIMQKADYEPRNSYLHPTLFPRQALRANTGGTTTGVPFAFFLHRGRTRAKERAHFDWFWRQLGYTPAARLLMVRGRPLPQGRPLMFETFANRLAVSCFKLGATPPAELAEAIRQFRPEYIHAYPSALRQLLHHLGGCDTLRAGNLRGVFLGSEQISESEMTFFQRELGVEVLTWYGHSECLVHAGYCLRTREYHVYPFYGYLELVNDEDRVIGDSHSVGRMIATGFDNEVMPLIRYDTGDLAVWSGRESCPCGFVGRSLSSIEGRQGDYIFLSDHSRVSLTAFFYAQHFDQMSRVRAVQMVQERAGTLLVRLSPGEGFRQSDPHTLAQAMEKSVSGRLKVEVSLTDQLELTPNGKRKALIQRCPAS